MGDKKQKTTGIAVPFIYHGLFGATGGAVAICMVQPADLLKTRMQLLSKLGKRPSMFTVASDIIRTEGFKGLYKGLSAAILRQYTYGLTRFAIFYTLADKYEKQYGVPSLTTKLLIGIVAGIGGSLTGNPPEVALIRMTADGQLAPEKRRNYTNVFNALFRISKEEGILTLWRGVAATATRAAIVTSSELGSYAQARQVLIPQLGDNIKTHFAASLIAGLCCTTASLPVDIVKTRVQNSSRHIGQISALKDIIKNEGVLALWSGFLPTYLKLGPHAIITFLLFEQFYIIYFKFNEPKVMAAQL